VERGDRPSELVPEIRPLLFETPFIFATMNKITRSERIMTKLVDGGVIKETSKAFLVASLDPMHDAQIESLEGWPDVETAASVVRCIKQSVSISAPSGLGGQTWDCHIVAWPWPHEIVYATPATTVNNFVTSNAQPPLNTNVYGGVQAFACDPTITSDFVPGALAGIQSAPIGVVDLTDPTYLSGPSRIIGMGWEVNNTTSQLNKQGMVTVFRLPEPRMIPQDFAGVNIGSSSGQIFRPPPKNTQSAMLISGTRQWPAADGCYVVVPFVGQDNPPLQPDYVQPIIQQFEAVESQVTQTSINQLFNANNTSPVLFPYHVNNGSGITAEQCCKICPLHQTGAIFTGLSLATTLTLQVNYYVESFPGLAEKSILVLATPSAEYDPRALELFSHCLRTLPVGVPAGMNGNGDWFADAVLSLASVAEPIAGMIHPALGMGVKMAGKAAGAYLAANGAQTKPTTGQILAADAKRKKKKKKAKARAKAETKAAVVANSRPARQ
jgi:hypothetical protein